MAEGALQELSARREMTMPEPKPPLPRKPTLKTVMMARPWGGKLGGWWGVEGRCVVGFGGWRWGGVG